MRIPTHRVPTHPGEMLLEEFLKPMNLTPEQLANGINVPYEEIKELIEGSRGMTPSIALRFAKFFGISADFWMNVQLHRDLFYIQQSEAEELEKIQAYIA